MLQSNQCLYFLIMNRTSLPLPKEGRALTGFSGPPKSQKIKVPVRHFILYVLIDEMSKCFNLILILLLWLLWLHKMAANMG